VRQKQVVYYETGDYKIEAKKNDSEAECLKRGDALGSVAVVVASLPRSAPLSLSSSPYGY